MKSCVLMTACCALLAATTSVFGTDTFTWTGGANDGLWSSGGNWDKGVAPTNTVALKFVTAGENGLTTLTDDIAGLSIAWITYGASGSTLAWTINGTETLNVNGSGNIFTSPILTGSLTFNCPVTVSGSGDISISSGYIFAGGLTAPRTIRSYSGHTVWFGGTSTIGYIAPASGITFGFTGTTTISSGMDIDYGGTVIVTNGTVIMTNSVAKYSTLKPSTSGTLVMTNATFICNYLETATAGDGLSIDANSTIHAVSTDNPATLRDAIFRLDGVMTATNAATKDAFTILRGAAQFRGTGTMWLNKLYPNVAGTTNELARMNLGAFGIYFGGDYIFTQGDGTTLGAYADWSANNDIKARVLLDGTVTFDTTDARDGATARTISMPGEYLTNGVLHATGVGTVAVPGTTTALTTGFIVDSGTTLAITNGAAGTISVPSLALAAGSTLRLDLTSSGIDHLTATTLTLPDSETVTLAFAWPSTSPASGAYPILTGVTSAAAFQRLALSISGKTSSDTVSLAYTGTTVYLRIANPVAGTFVWTGGADDGLFSSPDNWDAGIAPTNGCALKFATAWDGLVDLTNDIPNLAVTGVTVAGNGSPLAWTVNGPNTLTVTTGTGVANSGTSTITFNCPVIYSVTSGEVGIGNHVAFDGGLQVTNVTLRPAAGAECWIRGDSYIKYLAFNSAGNTVVLGGGKITLVNGHDSPTKSHFIISNATVTTKYLYNRGGTGGLTIIDGSVVTTTGEFRHDGASGIPVTGITNSTVNCNTLLYDCGNGGTFSIGPGAIVRAVYTGNTAVNLYSGIGTLHIDGTLLATNGTSAAMRYQTGMKAAFNLEGSGTIWCNALQPINTANTTNAVARTVIGPAGIFFGYATDYVLVDGVALGTYANWTIAGAVNGRLSFGGTNTIDATDAGDGVTPRTITLPVGHFKNGVLRAAGTGTVLVSGADASEITNLTTGLSVADGGTLALTNGSAATVIGTPSLTLASGGKLVFDASAAAMDRFEVAGTAALAGGTLDFDSSVLASGRTYTNIVAASITGADTVVLPDTNKFLAKVVTLDDGRQALVIRLAQSFYLRIAENDGIDVPYDWISGKLPGVTITDEAAVSNALVSAGSNGVPFWESYVLGLDPTNAASRVLCDAAQDAATGTVTVNALNVNPPTGIAATIRYVLEGSADGSGWSAYSAVLTQPTATITLSDAAPAYYRFRADIVL